MDNEYNICPKCNVQNKYSECIFYETKILTVKKDLISDDFGHVKGNVQKLLCCTKCGYQIDFKNNGAKK